ncbi:MAG: hypothetical protein ACRC28_13355 [Clostridium sp.]|uniref:hypothetical protein n=1 Tax=Clostridium sp. TaxID=1506 RepID=UPI003F34B2B8
MDKPNIFRYSRGSELNTAIIGWMIDNAVYKTNITEIGTRILKKMLKENVKEIRKLKSMSMYKNISVVVEINDDMLLAIEDITFAKNRSSMLRKKREILINDERYKDRKKVFAYINVGNKNKLSQINEENCVRIRRNDILQCFEGFENKELCLVEQYMDYLLEIESMTNKHDRENDFINWHRLTWEGYFTEIKKVDTEAEWEYTSSQKGDTINLDFNKVIMKYPLEEGEIEYSIYLTMGTELPCRYNYNHNDHKPYMLLKVEVLENIYKTEVRNYVWDKISEIKKKYECRNFLIEKTSHAIGTHMTIGKIENIQDKQALEKALDNLKFIFNELKNENSK